MSTVLTKPVLLDETGQAIVGKLDEIKEAIDNGGTEKYPVLIHITTPPTKSMYKIGEPIDYTGIVVKAVFSNNVEYDVTSQCTFYPVQGTPYALDYELYDKAEMTVSYTWHPTGTTFTASMILAWNRMKALRVGTPPTKTTYEEGETLDLTGLVVEKVYTDDSVENVTSSCTFSPVNGAVLTPSDTEVTIYYQETESPSGTTWQTWQAITVNELVAYGVQWDGTASSALTRTGKAANFVDPVPYVNGATSYSSPFDNIMPWSGMQIVQDPNAGTMVQIPKYYYKWEQIGNGLKLEISPEYHNGFNVSPAHEDRGDGQGERDYVYIGAYPCASTNLKSLSGVTTFNYGSPKTTHTNIHLLGDEVWQWDYAMYMTIMMLYLVEFADWNPRKTVGVGQISYDNPTNGGSDSIPYHTGTTAATKVESGDIKYRHIENLWAVKTWWITGIYKDTNDIYIVKNPNDFSYNIADMRGGVLAGSSDINANTWGNLVKMKLSNNINYVLIPNDITAHADSDYETYICGQSRFYLAESFFTAPNTSVIGWTSPFGIGTTDKVNASSIGGASTRIMVLPNNT